MCSLIPALLLVSIVHCQETEELLSDNTTEKYNVTEPELSPLDNFKDETFKDYFLNENRLFDYLFEDYKRQVPAFYLGDRYGKSPKPTTSNATLMYSKLLTVDEPKQSTTMIIEIFLYWLDPRLSWNPNEFNGVTVMAVTKQDTVWIPDILPLDMLFFQENIPEDRQVVNLYSDGTVTFYWTSVIEFICQLNLADFPFDQQTCTLRFSCYNAPRTELLLTGLVDTAIPLDIMGNGEWTMINITAENIEIPGALNNSFDTVRWNITIKRSSTFYVMLMIIPSFILTILCVCGLFWESVDGQSYMDNLNLGFAAILAMMLVLQMSTQNMPKIDQVDKLSRYSMVNLGLIAFASVLVMIMGKSKMYQTIITSRENYPDKMNYRHNKFILYQHAPLETDKHCSRVALDAVQLVLNCLLCPSLPLRESKFGEVEEYEKTVSAVHMPKVVRDSYLEARGLIDGTFSLSQLSLSD